MFQLLFGRVGEVRFGASLTRPEAVALRDHLNDILAATEPQPKPDPTNPAHAALAVEAARTRAT